MNKGKEILQMQMKLKKKLPRGWTSSIAKKLNTTKQQVSRVFVSWKTDSPIFSEILNLAEKHSSEQEKVNNRVQNLTS